VPQATQEQVSIGGITPRGDGDSANVPVSSTASTALPDPTVAPTVLPDHTPDRALQCRWSCPRSPEPCQLRRFRRLPPLSQIPPPAPYSCSQPLQRLPHADCHAGSDAHPTTDCYSVANRHPDTPTFTLPPTAAPTFTPVPLPTPIPVPTATLFPTATPATEAPGLRTECIFYDGLVPISEADEYVQIVNSGPASVDLAEWRLQDVADGRRHTHVFFHCIHADCR